jgi:hypothetical protein
VASARLAATRIIIKYFDEGEGIYRLATKR